MQNVRTSVLLHKFNVNVQFIVCIASNLHLALSTLPIFVAQEGCNFYFILYDFFALI
jgi:hypothetical protein